MPDIHSLGPDASSRYAKDQQTLTEYTKQYKVPPDHSGFIKAHTEVLDTKVRPPHIDVLMGTNQKITWAGFTTPLNFHAQRPTTDYVLAPPEQLEADSKRLTAVMEEEFDKMGTQKDTSTSDLPGQPVLNVLVEAMDYNDMVEGVKGAMNAFLQG